MLEFMCRCALKAETLAEKRNALIDKG